MAMTAKQYTQCRIAHQAAVGSDSMLKKLREAGYVIHDDVVGGENSTQRKKAVERREHVNGQTKVESLQPTQTKPDVSASMLHSADTNRNSKKTTVKTK